MRMGRAAVVVAVIALAVVGTAFSWLYATRGAYGVDALLRRGGAFWTTMPIDDARLSPSMRLALRAVLRVLR
jgi:hypothetical protein